MASDSASRTTMALGLSPQRPFTPVDVAMRRLATD